MIIRPRYNWFRMLFVWQGSVLPQVLPRLLILFVVSLGVTYFHGTIFQHRVPLTAAPFTLFGVALAIFLGFYNNVSYDRYWEGRKLWGALLNDTRSLARQALTMSGYPASSAPVTQFVRLLIAFTHTLRHQLRHTDPAADLQRLLPPELAYTVQQAHFRPMLLLREMGRWLQQARETGHLDTNTQLAFDRNLNQLSDIVGGCERLASTPVPYTYSVLLHRTVYLYCFLLPFGLVESISWATPLIVVFIGYTFMALDAIIGEIEEPFGTEPNDLALNTMSQMIETTLLEMADQPTPAWPPARTGYVVD
ncbi:putative membrane protein [Hymenobacter gelipurpurascens]|uniref:Putative membrane protein n=1 Tax=Hymenobacter gelipurpurascens TaxID=89968 RepID=A0A212T9R3_9BACT|nr:bestrophin family ion channel [Hymenobacter gelipurpurascens]SNC62554.1 putative membrane protein [Hymenobacter gelipurpurascens]